MDNFFIIFSLIIGLLIGSFINCLTWRIYKDESITGRSYCPKCRKQIAWYDNIPLLSFVLLKGKCRYCKQTISWQYPLVEFFTAILFALSFVININSLNFSLLIARDWLLISALMIVFIYDFRWQEVPMLIVWPATVLMIIFNLLLGYSIISIALYGGLGALFFLAQYLLTNKRGLGEGDIWLGLLLGVFLADGGKLILSLCLAYFLGAAVGIFLLASKKKEWKSKMALGPFLVFGAFVTLIYGEAFIAWYLGLF